MAVSPDRNYFPSLEACLKGEEVLLSWKLVASALSSQSPERLTSPAVSEFLKDAYVHSLFQSPSRAFEPSTPASKSDFEAKTAAINVTPAPNDKYDIGMVKDDALWLGRTVNINEVAALRLVVIELQTRHHSHLRTDLSSQDIANIRDASGDSSSPTTHELALVDTTSLPDSETIWTEFDSEDSRRERLLSGYLSERRYFMAFADNMTSFLLDESQSHGTSQTAVDALRRSVLDVANGFNEHFDPNEPAAGQSLAPLLSIYLEMLPACVKRADAGIESIIKETSVIFEGLRTDWLRTSLTEAVHGMAVVFQLLYLTRNKLVGHNIATRWFQFMADCEFLDLVTAGNGAPYDLVVPLRCLVPAISMAILNVDRSIAYVDTENQRGESDEVFIASDETLGLIHNTIWTAVSLGFRAAIAVGFAWSLILHRMQVSKEERAERRDIAQNQRAQANFELENQPYPSLVRRGSVGSIVSLEPARYDHFLAETMAGDDNQLADQLARHVTAEGAYDVLNGMAFDAGSALDAPFRSAVGSRIRLVLLDLLNASFPEVGYQPEPVGTLISVLSGSQDYWELTEDGLAGANGSVVATALRDPLLLQFYVQEALNRYPYESRPFTGLCRALLSCLSQDDRADVLVQALLNTPTLAFELPKDFDKYVLVREDEGAGFIETTEDVPLFSLVLNRKGRSPYERAMFIPSGSQGQILAEDERERRKVVIIDYEHSTLALIGKRLECNLARDFFDPILGFLELSETTEAISLLATMIRAGAIKSTSATQRAEAGLAILQEASRELPPTKDIIAVICDTLDTVMQDDLASSDESMMVVLAACVEFLHALLPICPARVWSYMARCQLLDTESRAGRLSKLTGTSDLVSERFHLLASSIMFFSSLIDSVTTSAVQRKMGSKAGNRLQQNDSAWHGVSDKILRQVSLSIAHIALDVYENTSTWKFASELQCSVLVREAVLVLDKVILNVFSFGDPDSSRSLTACLNPAAVYIIESFLSSQSGSLRFQPILASLLVAFGSPENTLYPGHTKVISERLTAVLKFATSLLRVARYLDKSSVAIETQLYQTTSLLARLCVGPDVQKESALALLGALVISTSKSATEPPSLLGYLGPQISRSYVHVLSNLDKPFERPQATADIWRFLTTVIKNRQQWMANCLLTGKSPRDALHHDGKVTRLSSDSILGIAKETLKKVGSIPITEALAVLEFFTAAQNHWPWTVFAIQSENDFLDELCKYVGQLDSLSAGARPDAMRACQHARVAGYIAEALAMQLYHLRQIGREEIFARDVLKHIDYFLRDGVTVSGYNHSLHVNFQKNFANRYTGCSLDDFKRTSFGPQELGTGFYYDLMASEKMLGFDSAWSGPRDNGFRNEMQMANVNLSLVDAQIALYHAWEFFLLELSTCLLPKNNRIVAPMLQVATQCLEANQNPQGPEQIFIRINQGRANLSLLLVQRLADCSMLPSDSPTPLLAVWTTILGVEEPFSAERLPYYRTLLKILYIVLRTFHHSRGNSARTSTSADLTVGLVQTTLNVLDRVVAQGFRTLVAMIHDPDGVVVPDDIALFTAILQACLSMPEMVECQTQVLNIMASQDILHVATSLFSWSDKLADKGDPVYGELSLLFLLELSALPAIAEQLACDGLLGHLTSATIAVHMRRENVSPLADSVGAQRCYSIWAKAMLPLLLNILIALGATIAPEVAYVLNQFPNLLDSSTRRFEAPGQSRIAARDAPQYITLLAISEVHSLALLTRVLAALRLNNNRDIPEVTWDDGPLLESIDFWLTRPHVLRERLVPLGSCEAEWKVTKPAAGSDEVDSKLEEKADLLLEAVKTVLNEALE